MTTALPEKTARVEGLRRARLVSLLASRVRMPVDALEVAAVLESMGITDRVAREDYDEEDVFSLAAAVYPEVRDRSPKPLARRVAQRQTRPRGTAAGLVLPLVPLVMLALVLERLHAGGASSGMLAAVAVGGALGALLANAVLLPVTQRAAVYAGNGQDAFAVRLLARAAPVLAIGVSILVALVASALAGFGAGTTSELAAFALAAVALAVLLVFSTAVALACGASWLLAGLGTGLVVAVVLAATVRVPPELDVVGAYFSMMLVLVSALAVTALGARAPLELPWSWRHVRDAAPTAVYGVLASTFLGLTSLVVWQALRARPLLATEIVLLSVIPIALASGHGERLMWRVWSELERALSAAEEPTGFDREGLAAHRRAERSYAAALGGLGVAATAVFAVTAALVSSARHPESVAVFAATVLGVGLFALGHFDSLFLIGLRRVTLATRALTSGTALLVVVAAATVPVSPLAAVAALPLGGLVFAIASHRGVGETAEELDWHYAEAF